MSIITNSMADIPRGHFLIARAILLGLMTISTYYESAGWFGLGSSVNYLWFLVLSTVSFGAFLLGNVTRSYYKKQNAASCKILGPMVHTSEHQYGFGEMQDQNWINMQMKLAHAHTYQRICVVVLDISLFTAPLILTNVFRYRICTYFFLHSLWHKLSNM